MQKGWVGGYGTHVQRQKQQSNSGLLIHSPLDRETLTAFESSCQATWERKEIHGKSFSVPKKECIPKRRFQRGEERKSPEMQTGKHWPSNMASSVFDREQERTVLTAAGTQNMPHKDGEVGGHCWNVLPQEHPALLLAALSNLIKIYSVMKVVRRKKVWE